MNNPFDTEITELEWKLQTACADYLTGNEYKGRKIIARHTTPFYGLKYYHPALEYRGDSEGAKYKRRGTTAGIPDWLFWGPKRWHGMIELKVANRKLNENQKKVHQWATEYGFPWKICSSVAEARDTLIEWGWTCRNPNCKEPDYRNQQNKFADAFELYRP